MSSPLWDDCKWEHVPTVNNLTNSISHESIELPLAYFPELSDKIYLQTGPCYKVAADAWVVGQNESLSDRMDENEAILTLGGPLVEKELIDAAPIQTGECTCTSGGFLPVTYIIHAVGPRYDERYLTAAEHALFTAYKSALLLAAEKGVSDLVISCIYSRRKNFPRYEAAHIALRSVRKFFNHGISQIFRRVMFCVPTQKDFEIYSLLLSAYFPRTQIEWLNSGQLLPSDMGDDWGEIKLKERNLKLSCGPTPLTLEDHQKYRGEIGQGEGKSAEILKTGKNNVVIHDTPRDMTDVGIDIDEQRKRKVADELLKLTKEERLQLKYRCMVDTLDSTDSFDDVPELIRCVGRDLKGRDVLLINGYMLKSLHAERMLLYGIKIMEKYRCKPFTVLFLSPLEDPSIDVTLIENLFELMTARYKENIEKLLLFNPSPLLRFYAWTSMHYVRSNFWNVYRCISSQTELEKYINVTELDLQEHLITH